MTQTEKFTKAVGTRVDRRLAADGLNEVAIGLTVLAANGLNAFKEAGFQVFENPWLVGFALAALLLALIGVPAMRRCFVDPRAGFARPPRFRVRNWLCIAAVAVVYIVFLRMDSSGPWMASIFPVALTYMAHHYAAPRIYVAAGALVAAMLAFTQLPLSSAGWLACTASAAAVGLIATGTFAFIRFVRTTPEAEPVTP